MLDGRALRELHRWSMTLVCLLSAREIQICVSQTDIHISFLRCRCSWFSGKWLFETLSWKSRLGHVVWGETGNVLGFWTIYQRPHMGVNNSYYKLVVYAVNIWQAKRLHNQSEKNVIIFCSHHLSANQHCWHPSVSRDSGALHHGSICCWVDCKKQFLSGKTWALQLLLVKVSPEEPFNWNSRILLLLLLTMSANNFVIFFLVPLFSPNIQ